MTFPDAALPAISTDAFDAVAQTLSDFPCGPPAAVKRVKDALSQQPPTFNALIQAIGPASASTLTLAAALFKDTPGTTATVDGPLKVDARTGVLGTLHVKGDLHLNAPLAVSGHLVVDGVITHLGPPGLLAVAGSVRCRAMNTQGWMTIAGSLSVEHALWAEDNDHSLEVLGSITAGMIVSNEHLVSAKEKQVTLKPAESGPWGPTTFDARWPAHRQQLAQLLVAGLIDEDGLIDGKKLTSATPPWK